MRGALLAPLGRRAQGWAVLSVQTGSARSERAGDSGSDRAWGASCLATLCVFPGMSGKRVPAQGQSPRSGDVWGQEGGLRPHLSTLGPVLLDLPSPGDQLQTGLLLGPGGGPARCPRGAALCPARQRPSVGSCRRSQGRDGGGHAPGHPGDSKQSPPGATVRFSWWVSDREGAWPQTDLS